MSENTTTTNQPSPIQMLVAILCLEDDSRLIEVGHAAIAAAQVTRAGQRELFITEAAIVEVLCDRHPELLPVLDEWEHDLDGERSQLEVVLGWLEG